MSRRFATSPIHRKSRAASIVSDVCVTSPVRKSRTTTTTTSAVEAPAQSPSSKAGSSLPSFFTSRALRDGASTTEKVTGRSARGA